MNNILRSRLVRQLSPALIVVAVFLLAGLAGAAWFGSFDSLRAFLRGDLLAIQPQVINIGTVEWGTVLDPKVRVSNLTSRPIRIQGAIGDCPCMSPPPSLPLEVPPFGTRDLDLRVRAVGATGEGGVLVQRE